MGLLAATGLSAHRNAAADAPMPVDFRLYAWISSQWSFTLLHTPRDLKVRLNSFIAQKVGSVLEEDNQRGSCSLLEHMCFNGTQNFPGKESSTISHRRCEIRVQPQRHTGIRRDSLQYLGSSGTPRQGIQDFMPFISTTGPAPSPSTPLRSTPNAVLSTKNGAALWPARCA